MKITHLVLFLGLLGLASALPRIVVKGQRFFNPDTKEQFFCRGVAYAPTPNSPTVDPLTNTTAIDRDIPILQSMNINCIRVYQFFFNSDISASMKKLEDAGIYVLLDIFDPTDNINREEPAWNTDLFNITRAKISNVKGYNNLLGLIVGNEVTNSKSNTAASAFVKAAIRDVKSYIKTLNVAIPVGYATADDADIIDNLQTYFVCGDASTRADFYGINIYRWCSNTDTFESSGYQTVTNKYIDYPVPTILTEFGCIIQGSTRFRRNFTDVPVIFGTQMNGQFSGGIAYEYHTSNSAIRPEGNYGIVDFNADETVATLTDEGTALAQQYAAVKNTVGQAKMDAYTPNPKSVTCPAQSADWAVAGSVLPPIADNIRCTCLDNQFKCKTKVTTPSDITSDLGDKIGLVVGSICGNHPNWCKQIAANATTGVFGPYSMCGSLVKASLLMNYVYQDNGRCEFGQDADFQQFVEFPADVPACKSSYPNDSADLKDVSVINTSTSSVSIGDGGTQSFVATGTTPRSASSSLSVVALLLVSSIVVAIL